MNDFALNLPFNNVSFGQLGIGIAREIKRRGLNPCIFPIANQVDLSTQKPDNDFNLWLQTCINKAVGLHKRTNPCFKLWHIGNSLESFSEKQTLLTFFELDGLTPVETNILKNQNKVLVTSEYTKQVFNDYGVRNVEYLPLFYDSWNFHRTEKKYFDDGRISFALPGKAEPLRKRHAKVIQTWVKKFGNNKKYFLNAAIYNHFLSPEDNQRLAHQIMEGKSYFNVQFLGFMPNNEIYGDYLNANEICIGMGSESWNIPCFTACSLGRHTVILDYLGHKSWANSLNSVLVPVSSKIPAHDNMFFTKSPNNPFNQGNVADWDEDAFIAACEEAIKRVESNPVNESGLKLQSEFTVEKTVDYILSKL